MTIEPRLLAKRYQIDELIGRGGMADVYLGHDIKLDRKVAIKVLRSGLANDPAFRARFQQEALASSKMTHPGIVRVYDAGEDIISDGQDDRPFIVMEWVDGVVLKELIDKGPFSLEQALNYADQLLQALQYSHRAGIIHRDIKPGNIMITPDGRAKLMDFGIARAVSDSSATVEQTSTVLGTAQYFSPEQARGEVVDARTDLYSLGLVLFEMLTGKTPFEGDSAIAIAYQHVNTTPPLPSEIVADIPDPIDRLVLKSIVKAKEQRFQSANEFRNWLGLAAAGERVELPTGNISLSAMLGTEEDTAASMLFRDISSGQAKPQGSQKRPPVVWLWSGVIGVTVLLGALLFWVATLVPTSLSVGDTVKVPDVVNATWESAKELLDDFDLQSVNYMITSDDVEAGNVISTDPIADQVVNKNIVVKVYVSSGAATLKVPSLSNLTEDAAKKKLEDMGLVAGSVQRDNSPNIAKDIVISSDPAKDAEVYPGDTVNLIVSNGKVLLPNLRNQPLAEATKTLQALQLLANSVPDDSCEFKQGTPVINQSVAPGQVDQRSEIKIYYCSGVAGQDNDD